MIIYCVSNKRLSSFEEEEPGDKRRGRRRDRKAIKENRRAIKEFSSSLSSSLSVVCLEASSSLLFQVSVCMCLNGPVICARDSPSLPASLIIKSQSGLKGPCFFRRKPPTSIPSNKEVCKNQETKRTSAPGPANEDAPVFVNQPHQFQVKKKKSKSSH